MTGATLIYLAGRECELRDISAAAYLGARAEAAEIAEKRGANGEDEALIFAACLTAKGLYEGGERVFRSGDEALEGLSAREIAFAAAEYAAAVPTIAPPEDAAAPGAVQSDASAPEAADGGEYLTVRREPDGEIAPVSGRKYGFMQESAAQEEKDGEVYIIHESAAEPSLRGSMRETSDFFRRDSRRYDGEFERY